MIDARLARFTLTDANSQRFSIPEEIVSKPQSNKNMRLDMVGFNIDQSSLAPFSFSFRDVEDPNNFFLDTAG